MIDSLHRIVAKNPYMYFPTSSGKLVRYGSYLKEQYLENVTTYSFDGSCDRVDKIFNLAMIKEQIIRRGKIEDRYVRMTITGKVDDILHNKSPIELKDILKPTNGKRKVILMEGAPGSGKTTLTLHICQKWGKDELFQEYSVIVMIQLRDPAVQSAQTIANLLPCRDTAMAEEMAAEITAKDGEGVLWILDGWDELPSKLQQQSLFRHLITLPAKCPTRKSAVIITSRPISSVNLHRFVSCRIEILGFTEKELKKFFTESLSNESPSVVEALVDQVNENPVLESSCYLPLNAAIITHVYQCNNHSLPQTQYELFLIIILNLIFRQVKKEGGHDNLTTLEALEEIPAELMNHFQALSKLAYNGIMENRVAFNSKDLPKCINTLGLLQKVESFGLVGKCVSYHFLHLTFQEFLAAHYIATSLPTEEQVSQFTELYNKPRFSVVFQFYAAITKLEKTGFPEMISHMGPYYEWWNLSFFHCVYEAQDPDLCIFVAEKLLWRKLNISFISLTPIDCLCIGYFMACVCGSTIDSLKVDLSSAYIGDSGCRFLLKDLSASTDNFTASLSLSLPGSQLREAGLQSLTDYLCSSGSQALQTLTLGYKEPSVVVYVDSDASESDLLLPLSKALEINSTLTELSLVKSSLRVNEANGKALATMLKANKSLQVLNLAKNPEIGDQGALHIAEGLKVNSTLKTLNLNDCGITLEGIENVAQALTVNKTLQDFDIGRNYITDTGVVCLAKALKANIGLAHLNLAECGMTDESLNVLGTCIAENRSLKTLCIGQEEMQVQNKKSIFSLSYFHFKTQNVTCITEKGLMQLAAQLNGSNSSLETLEISNTLLTDSLLTNEAMKKLKKKVHVRLYFSDAIQNTGLRPLSPTRLRYFPIQMVQMNRMMPRSQMLSAIQRRRIASFSMNTK